MTDRMKVVDLLRENGAKARALVEVLCRENERLSRHPIFLEPDGGLPWTTDAWPTPPSGDDSGGTSSPPSGPLDLPWPLIERIANEGPDWPSEITSEDWAGLDFSWLHGLESYDSYWPGAPPIPHAGSLVIWTKLRLVQGLQAGDFATAAVEVQHFADLLHTQGLVGDDSIGAAMLREVNLMESLAIVAGQSVSGLRTVSPDALDEFHRIQYSVTDFFLPGVPSDVAERASHCLPPGCGQINLALDFTASVSAATFDAVGSNRDLLLKLARDRRCDPALADQAKITLGAARGRGELKDVHWFFHIDQLIQDGGAQ